MNTLSSLIFHSDDSRLANNIEVISTFPNDDKSQIKANHNGTLKRADGKAWAVNYMATKAGWKTNLSGTVEAIEKTFKTVTESFSNDLNQKEHSPAIIEKLTNDLLTEFNMLKGLQNIQAVYLQRYQNSAAKDEALSDLNTLVGNYSRVIQQHRTDLSKLADQHKPKHTKDDLAVSSLLSENLPFSLEKYQSCLEAYLGKWSPKITFSEASIYINLGRDILKLIMTGKINAPVEATTFTESTLTSLMWFLMHCALEKHQGHSEGSFAMEDNGGRLYNYLLLAKGCGDRESSHYYGRSPAWTGVSKHVMKSSWHKGIDVITGKLPAEKRHVLFGQVEPLSKHSEKLLFIKLESHSPFKTTGYGYDATMHGVGLANAQINKMLLPDSDDQPEMAKERVPSQVLNEFINIVSSLGDYLPQLTKCLAEKGITEEDPIQAAKTYGIAYMTLFVQQIGSITMHHTVCDLQGFNKALPKLDHMDKRTGREVYISKEELARI